MSTKKSATKKTAAPKNAKQRTMAACKALADRVRAVHEIDQDAAIALLQQKDEAKVGQPDYTLVVSAFGRAVAKAMFSEDAVADDAPKAKKARAKKDAPKKAPKEKKAPAERKRQYTPQTITRTYKGKEYEVVLAANGTCTCGAYEYSSLTACALEITGYGARGKRISGPAFFRIDGKAA